jgi:hypothetical protein
MINAWLELFEYEDLNKVIMNGLLAMHRSLI